MPQIGQRISHYKILGKLGQGGMGEVYLAEEISLDRKVALKFLNPELQRNELSRVRFRREARSAASLDHPYICNIFEVGKAEQGDFIAMEYLEGQTLESRLQKGPLPIQDALNIACETAEALEEAHQKGIVHRDIKPSNIMLTASGHVKIMDFGLAKQLDQARDTIDSKQEISTTLTAPGVIPGTPIYMSPEQLLQKDIDQRSDIFSFGVVLYEMVTGLHPFRKPSSPMTYNAIINEAPPPLPDPTKEISAQLEQVLKKMLAKEPNERYSSMHEIRSALTELAEKRKKTGRLLDRYWRHAILLTLTTIAIVLGAPPIYRSCSPAEPFPELTPLVTEDSEERQARFSPDGKWFTYLSQRNGRADIWRRSLAGGDPLRIETIEGNPLSHTWSPDGEELVCLLQQGSKILLQVLPALYDGIPRINVGLEEPLPSKSPRVLRWIGNDIYLLGDNSIWSFDPLTEVTQRITRNQQAQLRGVSIRADAEKMVFQEKNDIWIADLDGENIEGVTNDPWTNGHPGWIKRAGEWRIVFSSTRGGQEDIWEYAPHSGDFRPLTFGAGGQSYEDSSLDGSLVIYRNITEEANLWCHDLKTEENRELTSDSLSDYAPSLVSDSSLLAFERANPSVVQGSQLLDTAIWLAEIDYPKLSQPKPILDTGHIPKISPDGRWLAYLRFSLSKFELHLRDLASHQDWSISEYVDMRRAGEFPRYVGPENILWSRTGSTLFFVEKDPETDRMDLKSLTPTPGEAPGESVLVKAGNPGEQIVSPKTTFDGSSLAYATRKTDESGEALWEVRLMNLPSGREQTIFSNASRIRCLGWVEGSLVALREYAAGIPPGLEIIKIPISGESQTIGRFGSAWILTAVLNEQEKVLYLTVNQDGIHNIYTLELSTKNNKRLTDNKFPYITYSGLQTCGSGRLLYARQERKSDLWLMRFNQ